MYLMVFARRCDDMICVYMVVLKRCVNTNECDNLRLDKMLKCCWIYYYVLKDVICLHICYLISLLLVDSLLNKCFADVKCCCMTMLLYPWLECVVA